MKSTTSLRLLTIAALATPLLAFWPQDPDPGQTDWAQHVDNACSSRRYATRLAAGRKVAAGGDAAVPAVRAYADENGLDSLPVSLVDAIADSPAGGPAVLELLTDWASNRDFYWRSAAMRGLALRAPRLADSSGLRALFAAHHEDPAWLTRTHARLGSMLCGDDTVLTLPEPDPRARVRLITLLMAQGRTPPLQPLFDALADERTFLGDPWGQRIGAEAHKALKAWLGEEHPLIKGGSFASKQVAIGELREAVKQKSGQEIALPRMQVDEIGSPAGGIEILSCKFGDQFVQWSPDGLLRFGITGEQTVQLPEGAWRQLSQSQTNLALTESLGVVICDSMRIWLSEPKVHVKVAPESLPTDAAEWLKQLAQRLEEAEQKGLADDLRRGLGQFVGP